MKIGVIRQCSSALYASSQDLKESMFRRKEECSGFLSGIPGDSTA
jgi:hypothetical protein